MYRVLSLSLFVAAFVVTDLSAQTPTKNVCGALAPDLTGDANPPPPFEHLFRTRAYLKCRQSQAGATQRVGPAPEGRFVLIPNADPKAINAAGDVTGNYFDSNGEHGFIFSHQAALTLIDIPAATYTHAAAISASGEIAGYFHRDESGDCSGGEHGFVRAKNGAITYFDIPNAYETRPVAFSQAGDLTGFFYECGGRQRGFLRSRDGALTLFDVPPVSGASEMETEPVAINPEGEVTGNWRADPTGRTLRSGFLRGAGGGIVTFNVVDPQHCESVCYTTPVAINPGGVITGVYKFGSFRTPSHGFVRAPDGNFTMFNVSNLSDLTTPVGITPGGEVVGYYSGPSGTCGFIRARSGAFTTFNVPGAFDTYPAAVNPSGAVAGTYCCDAQGAAAGFIWTK
ncbi:hypothetical protein [Methylocystis parvus]|uniref:hypothetical protein n=1 Tax=Methylocystis parvus TaxID=134 RepID=UPI003C757DB2